MDLRTFLQHRIAQPLPGIEAQANMMPPIREKIVSVPDDAKLSAVMMLLYQHEGRWMIPLMRRAEDGRVHGGQISLPGGRKEESDTDFVMTALRETEEEFGIPREEIQVLGSLTEIYIPPSRFLVYPKIGVMPQRPTFQPDAKEVAEIIEVELFQFLEESRRGIHEVDVFGGHIIQAPGYTVNDNELIWGGTAMMLAELAHLLEEWTQKASF